jgi:hypothetical protein
MVVGDQKLFRYFKTNGWSNFAIKSKHRFLFLFFLCVAWLDGKWTVYWYMGWFGWIRQLASLPVRVYCSNVVFEDLFIVLLAYSVNRIGMTFKMLSVNFELLSQNYGQYHLVLFLYMFSNNSM